MKRIMTRGFAVAVGVIVLAAAVGAQRQGGRQGMGGQGMGQGMGPGMGQGQMGGMRMGPGQGGPMGALKLTPEQRAQIDAIMEQQRAEHQGVAEQMPAKHQALRDALFGEDPDQAAAIAAQIAEIEAQMQPSRIAMQIRIVKLLTPPQRAIAKELDLFGRMGQGPGGGGQMRGGPGRGGQAPIKK